jgi:hypothetical protein
VVALGLFLAGVAWVGLLPADAQASAYNSIGLEWTAGGDDGTIGRASRYEMRYSTSEPSGIDSLSIAAWWTQAGTQLVYGLRPPSMSGSPDSVRVTGLTPGTIYYFVLYSVDDGWPPNRSPFSNIANDTTLACDAPTIAPGFFGAVADTGRVDLSWSGSDPLARETHIYRMRENDAEELFGTLQANVSSFTDRQASPGVTYRYRVAWASVCADGPSTERISVTLPGLPAPQPGEALTPTVHAYPNPARGGARVNFVLDVRGSAPQPVRLRLYDLNGHWIADLVDGTYPPGNRNLITWSRTSRTGRPVAPGYYEALGTIGGVKVRERILLLP